MKYIYFQILKGKKRKEKNNKEKNRKEENDER